LENSYQKFTKHVATIGATTILQFLIGLVQLPLLTKTLGAHGYGIWAQVWVTVSLVLPFTNFGLGAGVIRFLAAEKNREEIQEQFYSVASVLFVTNLIASLAVITFAYPLAINFFDGAVQIVRITGILILIIPIGALYLDLLRTFQQIRKYSIFIIADTCSRLGLIAYLVLNGHGVLSVILSVMMIQVVILLVLFFLIKSQIGIKRPHFRRIKEYYSFGLPLVPRSLSYWLINLSDRYVIGFFLGVTPVGIYAAAYGIGGLPYTIVSVLTLVLMSPLSQLYDEGRMDEVKTHLRYSLKYFLTIAIPFVFGAAILAEPVLRVFSTSEIASGGRFVVPLLILAVSLMCVQNIISFILLLTKKTKTLAIIWVVAAVLNLGLNILLVPRLGILGAAITTLIAYALVLGFASYYSFKEFKFSIDWYFIIKSLIASAIMSVVTWQMSPQVYLDTILTVVAGVVIYGIVLVALRGFSKEEISFFWGLLRRSAPASDSDNGEEQ